MTFLYESLTTVMVGSGLSVVGWKHAIDICDRYRAPLGNLLHDSLADFVAACSDVLKCE
jgi:hypothetical protein